MIDYQLTPGTKIRCINNDTSGIDFLTVGKVYEVIETNCFIECLELQFWFIDDDGDTMYSSPSHREFEVIKE